MVLSTLQCDFIILFTAVPLGWYKSQMQQSLSVAVAFEKLEVRVYAKAPPMLPQDVLTKSGGCYLTDTVVVIACPSVDKLASDQYGVFPSALVLVHYH